jgi:hypothetical protein
MPPQQGYSLLDVIDDFLRFRAHAELPLTVICICARPGEAARNIGSCCALVNRKRAMRGNFQ